MAIRYRISELAEAIQADRGGLALLGLFERDPETTLPDLIVAADWVDHEREYESLSYVVGHMKKRLESADFLLFNRVVVLSPIDDFVREVQAILHHPVAPATNQLPVLINIQAAGIDIRRAVIAYSDPNVGGIPSAEAFGTAELKT